MRTLVNALAKHSLLQKKKKRFPGITFKLGDELKTNIKNNALNNLRKTLR